MGILDDTLLDAARPLPQLTLRRAIDDAAPEFDPEPAEESTAALTVFRLQKDGGVKPPAPPAPRALDASTASARPLHAPVGFIDDATLQFVTSRKGLETGKEPASKWNSDATDRQERLASPEPSHRLDYGASTGSSVFSNRVPSPFDDPGKRVHRTDSSDGMRRATGRGAPSGEFDTAAVTAAPGVTGTLRAGPGDLPRDAEGIATAVTQAAPHSTATPLQPRTAVARRDGPPTAHGATAGPAAQSATARSQATGRQDAPPMSLAMPTASPAPQPRLSIGRIEVTVLSAPQATAKPAAAPADAFLSKHYLRRL